MTIEKAYYSNISNNINIIIKDIDIASISDINTYINSINIIKVLSSSQHTFNPSTYTFTTSVDSDSLVIYINIADLVSTSNGIDSFSLDGISMININYNSTISNNSYLYNPEEFYSYKVNMYSSVDSPFDNKGIISDMTKFLFLESAMINAVELGYIQDATMFYNEMKRVYQLYRSIY